MSTSQEVASLVGAGQEIAEAVSAMVPESVLYGMCDVILGSAS